MHASTAASIFVSTRRPAAASDVASDGTCTSTISARRTSSISDRVVSKPPHAVACSPGLVRSRPPSRRGGAGVVCRFGDFAVNRATRQVIADDGEIHLSPKAFDLLVLLLANRERAVSKAELQEQLWPATFVEETNIAGLVVEVRRALRDTASNPSLLRTVYGFGYRFVGDVTEDARSPRPGQALF